MPDIKTSLRGEYENRIFQESNIEKIFEVFASGYRKNKIVMTYYDLLRSICPFNYSTKSPEELQKIAESLESGSIIKLFDLDGSRDITINEYVFLMTVHYMLEADVRQYFQNGSITSERFLELYNEVQRKYDLQLTETNILESRSVKIDKSTIENEKEVIKALFHDKPTLALVDFLAIKDRLNYELDYFRVG